MSNEDFFYWKASSRFPRKFAQTSIKETSMVNNRVDLRVFVIAGGHIIYINSITRSIRVTAKSYLIMKRIDICYGQIHPNTVTHPLPLSECVTFFYKHQTIYPCRTVMDKCQLLFVQRRFLGYHFTLRRNF